MLGPVRCFVAALVALAIGYSASSQDPERKPVLLGSLKHEGEVSGLRFSADGKTLTAVVCAKEKAMRWDLKTMKQRDAVGLSDPGLTTFGAYSGDGRLLLISSTVSRYADDPKKVGDWVRVWDLESGKEKASYHARYLGSSALSPDGKLLAVIERHEPLKEFRQAIKLLDIDAGTVFSFPEPETFRVYGLNFSPDGRTLALSRVERDYDTTGLVPKVKRTRAEVRLWDITTRKVRTTLTSSVDLMDVRFSPDGKTIATWASNEHTARLGETKRVELKLWDSDTGREKAELKGHRQTIYSASFSPDGKLLVTGTGSLNLAPLLDPTAMPDRQADGRELKVWDVATGKERANLVGHEMAIYRLAFSPDGRLLASWAGHSKRGELRLWDVAGGKGLPVPAGDWRGLESLVFSPDGKVLATGGDDGIVRLWDVSGVVPARK